MHEQPFKIFCALNVLFIFRALNQSKRNTRINFIRNLTAFLLEFLSQTFCWNSMLTRRSTRMTTQTPR